MLLRSCSKWWRWLWLLKWWSVVEVGTDRLYLAYTAPVRPRRGMGGGMQAAWSALVALWGLEGKLASIDTSIDTSIVMSGDIGDIRSLYQRCLQINTVAEVSITFFFVGLVRAVRVHRIPPAQPLHGERTERARMVQRRWMSSHGIMSCRCSTIARSAEAGLPCPALPRLHGMGWCGGRWWVSGGEWCGRLMCEW